MEILLEIREEMSREADFDVDLFAEIVRSGKSRNEKIIHDFNGEKEVKTVSARGKKKSAN